MDLNVLYVWTTKSLIYEEIKTYNDMVDCCRFKDTEAALMYERAGYTEVQRDNFVLRPLLGLQRRFLMTKLLIEKEEDVQR